MRRRLALAVITAGVVFPNMALAGVVDGHIVARDRERHLIQLDDGSVYYLPNLVFWRDFWPGRWVTIWFTVKDDVRVIVNHHFRRRRRVW